MAASDTYTIRLSTGEWYAGCSPEGERQWTHDFNGAHVFSDVVELGSFLEWLEESEHEYLLLKRR